MTRSPSELMQVNLLEVFNEPDPARRATIIAENYADDVVWHEPDRIIRGLFISPSTVEYHLRKVFRKLDRKSRLQLARRMS